MKLHGCILLTLAAMLTPGIAHPVSNTVDTAVNVPKLSERTSETKIRDLVWIEKEDSSAVTRRTTPDIEMQIRDPAAIES